MLQPFQDCKPRPSNDVDDTTDVTFKHLDPGFMPNNALALLATQTGDVGFNLKKSHHSYTSPAFLIDTFPLACTYQSHHCLHVGQSPLQFPSVLSVASHLLFEQQHFCRAVFVRLTATDASMIPTSVGFNCGPQI
jgi:hypothetical protein